MTPEEILKKLEPMGYPSGDWRLEPFTLLVEDGPPGAFDHIGTYALHDNRFDRRLDGTRRDWKPLLVIDQELSIGPSPDLLSRQLQACRYFDSPSRFGKYLVFQMHGFALDGYQGYQCQEESVEYEEDCVTIRGMTVVAGRGQPASIPFSTRSHRSGKTEFLPEEPKRRPGRRRD